MDAASLLPLLNGLAAPAGRREGASRLAAYLGAEDLLILLRDEETGRFLPAPGFQQTLPGGPTWRRFLNRCAEPGSFECEVAFPDLSRMVLARAFTAQEGVRVTLLGGQPNTCAGDLVLVMPLLGELLKAECTAVAARGHIAAARQATRRSGELATALDTARTELSAKAVQLWQLNATLEERVAKEIEERSKAEEALRQAQKMEAIGQLTGGVAHDFNNLLTVILGGLDAIGRQLAAMPESHDVSRMRRSQDMARHASQRAATLTSRLLAFSRRQPLDPKPLDGNRLIAGLTEMLRSTLGEQIEIEAVSSAGLWRAHADAAELENAIVNLAVNARDAMPNGGKLTVETGNVLLDEAYVHELAEPVPAGQYVLIAVSDTGTGMDRATVDRVFEPFFTTKEIGKGTGLGLSQVYGFVRQSNGHIRVYSEPGHGTSVKIYLPRLRSIEAEGVDAAPRPSMGPLGGAECILVVEDHEDLRAYSTGVLRELGYRVLEAPNARSALQLLQSDVAVDLLFTDVVLPEGMHGRQLAEKAQALRPTLKVLYTSGYTRNAIVHNGRLDAGVNLLSKPFTYEALAVKVRRLLDEI